MTTKSKGGVAAIIATATKEAAASRDANYINIHTRPDLSALVLTTVISGKPLAWITYDASQLDELIRLLQAHRADLK